MKVFKVVLAAASIVSGVLIAGCDGNTPSSSLQVSENAVESLNRGGGTAFSWSEPIEFTLSPEDCPNISTVINGSGTIHYVVRVTVTGNGKLKLSLTENSRGTASGLDGSQYVFNYASALRNIEPDFESFPITIDIIDHFNLLGRNGAGNLSSWFKGTFILLDEETFVPQGSVQVRGNPSCDPI